MQLWPALLAYALFGLGYIGYMTFVVAFLRADTVAPIVVQGFWVLLGGGVLLFLIAPLIQKLMHGVK